MKGVLKASTKIGLTVAIVMLIGVLAACAPQQTSGGGGDSVSNGEGEAVIGVEWSPDADCAVCHTAQNDSYSDTACTAAMHANMECASCHKVDDKLTSMHEGVTSDDKQPKRLKKTAVSDDLCLTCHVSYEELATKTADYKDLVDAEGTIVNPHALPETEKHNGRVCGDCHKMHESGQDMAKNSMQYCRSCHHEDVFECNTCHNE